MQYKDGNPCHIEKGQLGLIHFFYAHFTIIYKFKKEGINMKRRPKGYGSVYKLKGARSHPYVTTVTLGNDHGKQIRKPIAYSDSYEQAEEKLYLYHMDLLGFIPKVVIENPQLESKYVLFMKDMIMQRIIPDDPRNIKNIDLINTMFEARLTPVELQSQNYKTNGFLSVYSKTPTIDEIWEIVKEKELKLAKRTLSSYESVYKKLDSIKGKPIDKIKLTDIENIFESLEEQGYGYYSHSRLKSILSMIFNYAEKHDYINKNFIKFIKPQGKKDYNKKGIFTNDQIKELINLDSFASRCTLICIFTGMRPGELLDIKKANVHVDEKYLIGGIKTAAGINRTIPLHEFIIPYIKLFMKGNKTDYLIHIENKHVKYRNYLSHYYNKMKVYLNFDDNLTPHSGRKTFGTLAKECGMDSYYRKCIIGHSHQDITDNIYTEPRLDHLLKEINKIKIEGIC